MSTTNSIQKINSSLPVAPVAVPLTLNLVFSQLAQAQQPQNNSAGVGVAVEPIIVGTLLSASFLYLSTRFIARPLLRSSLRSAPVSGPKKKCVRCYSKNLKRVSRSPVDHAICALSAWQFNRYRCQNCNWSGLFRTRG